MIEMLVVLAIVVVLAAVLSMSIALADAARSRSEARKLAALLELALDESRATGRSIAWSAESGGYAFWRMGEDGDWERFPPGSPFRPRTLPPGTQVRDVRLDAQPLRAGERIVFSPYGLSGAMQITVASEGVSHTLRAGMLGRISVRLDEDAGEAQGAARSRIHAG